MFSGEQRASCFAGKGHFARLPPEYTMFSGEQAASNLVDNFHRS